MSVDAEQIFLWLKQVWKSSISKFSKLTESISSNLPNRLHCVCLYLVTCCYARLPGIYRLNHNGPKMPQSSERGQTLHLMSLRFLYRKGRYCNRNFRWSCLCFADWRAEAVHHFRQTHRAEAGSEALWWFCLFLPSHLVRYACLSIWKINKDLCLVLLFRHITFHGPLGSPPWREVLNLSACVFDFLSNSLTPVSLTAGTEKPFSSRKRWYRRRPVG